MKYVHHGGRATPLQHASSCLSIIFQMGLLIGALILGTYLFIQWG